MLLGPELLIPLIALVLSGGTLIVTITGNQHTTQIDYTKSLEARIVNLEARLHECEGARERLADENLDMMRRYFAKDHTE